MEEKRQQLIKKAKKHYIHFLKFTHPKVEEYPRNLLELLDHSRNRWIKLKNYDDKKK